MTIDLKDVWGAWLAILFLMPGVWFDFGYRISVPRDEDIETGKLLMGYFAVSCLWLPIYLVLQLKWGNSYGLAVFVGSAIPVVAGGILGKLRRSGKVSWFFRWFGIVPTGMVRYAWNHQFLKLSKEKVWVYILVRLKNGNSVIGLYGERSYSGLGMPDGDLFLEKVYSQTENGYQEIVASSGIWVSAESIETVEFFESPGTQVGG